MSQRRILVTGAGGFVGSHLIEYLNSQGDYDIHATSYSDTTALEKFVHKETIHRVDLTDVEATANLVKTVKPDTVFHLASISVVQGSEEIAGKILQQNVGIQYSILNAVQLHAKEAKCIAVCSADEYGLVKKEDIPIGESTPLRPNNAYAVSKIAQDFLTMKYHIANGLDTVTLRPFNHTGERQTPNFVIPAFAKQIAEIEKGETEPTVYVGNLDAIRDFTDVKDMVRAYVLAAEKGVSGEVYNIGSGKGVSIQEILDTLIALSKVDITVAQEKSRTRPSDVPVLIADATKFRSVTGWKPEIPLDKTLERVLNYWRDQTH